jgi:predicted CXXCH cytochrome family protein
LTAKKHPRLFRPSLRLPAALAFVLCVAGLLIAANTPPPQAQALKDAETCGACHEAVVKAFPQKPHAAVSPASCTSCHIGSETHLEKGGGATILAFKASDPAPKKTQPCLTCHEEASQASFLGGMHARRGVDCTSCHSVHDAHSQDDMLKTATESATCFSCHKAYRAKSQRSSHHPILEGKMSCASCHNPHDGTNPKMVTANSVNEKCYECHAEKRGPFSPRARPGPGELRFLPRPPRLEPRQAPPGQAAVPLPALPLRGRTPGQLVRPQQYPGRPSGRASERHDDQQPRRRAGMQELPQPDPRLEFVLGRGLREVTMTRNLLLVALLVGSLSATALAEAGQETPAPAKNWLSSSATLMLLGRGDVDSSKFEEYRTVPKGVSMPRFSLAGRLGGFDFSLSGENISRRDQRYTGTVVNQWFKVTFDYNEIMHNIGFAGRTLFNDTAPGVWSLSSTLRGLLQTKWDSTPSSQRTYPWLVDFWGPSLAAGNTVDVSLQRNRGTYAVELGRALGFDLKMSYIRETRRGSKDTTPVYVSSQIFELPTPTDYLTQDFGLTAALNRKWGNLHGGFHYNWFKNDVSLMLVDNPLRATDAPYVNNLGGPARGHNVMAPDNSATSFSLGGMAKFGRSTRLLADVALGQWKQNAPFFPYTFNTAVQTGDKLPANLTSSLPAASLNGKIQTTTMNFSFVTRPVEPLYINVRYRLYDFDNKTPRITSPGYVSWDRSWSTSANTSIPYGYKTGRFETILGWEFGRALSLEARSVKSSMTGRSARPRKPRKKPSRFRPSAAARLGAPARRLRERQARGERHRRGGRTFISTWPSATPKGSASTSVSPSIAHGLVSTSTGRPPTRTLLGIPVGEVQDSPARSIIRPDRSTRRCTTRLRKHGRPQGTRGSATSRMVYGHGGRQDRFLRRKLKFKIVPDKWTGAVLPVPEGQRLPRPRGSAAVQKPRGERRHPGRPRFDDTSITSSRPSCPTPS